MAITNKSITLPTEISEEIIQNTINGSAVMQLANPIALSGHGLTIPVILGDPEAYFVDEGEVKTNADAKLDTKVMKPRTIAVIEPFSNQFRDNMPALYAEMVNRLPYVLAERFDTEVFHGTAVDGFDTLATASAVSLGDDAWGGLVTARETIETADGELTGFAMANQGITKLLAAKDGMGRPLFVDSVHEGDAGSLLGVGCVKAKKAYKKDTPNVLGFAGDWSAARYGVVTDVNITIADQATLTGVGNLFEKNMFAVRAEIEVGFVAQGAKFAKVTA